MPVYLYCEFSLGQTQLLHSRKVYDFFALLGDVGATVGVIEVIFQVLMGPIA